MPGMLQHRPLSFKLIAVIGRVEHCAAKKTTVRASEAPPLPMMLNVRDLASLSRREHGARFNSMRIDGAPASQPH
jgi:hypothetical protein